jgi:Raf kinase inhibitor-like YbhB/YbcL family protein
VLVDIPATVTAIDQGADSDKLTPHGKPPGPAPVGVRGVNDYTKWFAGDEAMKGEYGGYDGPCPPWNDAIVHHYHFKVFALDLPSLKLSGPFDGREVVKAMKSHILAQGESVGTYVLNPTLMKAGAAK